VAREVQFINILNLLYESSNENTYKSTAQLLSRGEKRLELTDMVVSGEEALAVADALTSTTFRILQLLSRERLDVSTLAEKLGLSEAYISTLITRLEKVKLISVRYEKGTIGVRKVCELAVGRITILTKPKE